MEFEHITVTRKAIKFKIFLKNVEDLIYDLVKEELEDYELNFKIDEEDYYMILDGIIKYIDSDEIEQSIIKIIKSNEYLEE